MKRCPQCHIEYFDETLEFCLEDGARLVSNDGEDETIPRVTFPERHNPTTEKTLNLPFSGAMPSTISQENDPALPAAQKIDLLKEKAVQKGNRLLEMTPFVVALAHNWWQWIYLDNQNYSSFSGYVLSANFLIWLLLLIVGAVAGLLAVRQCRVKTFAIAGLVVLSINLILFLVPRR